jgi:hypothetical protein
MVFEPTSRIPTKIAEVIYETRKIISNGTKVECMSSSTITPRSRYDIHVTVTDIKHFAIKINTLARPSTIENLTEFFSINRNE